MVLGQVKVGEKSNEIVAIPALLGLLAIEGAVVTVDAMGCQREIAQTIIDKKADYILALKGNQGTLRDDVELFAREQKAVAFKDTSVSRDTTVDGDHGRIETRTVTVFHDIGWLQDNHQWPGLKSVVMIESERETDGKVEAETRPPSPPITCLLPWRPSICSPLPGIPSFNARSCPTEYPEQREQQKCGRRLSIGRAFSARSYAAIRTPSPAADRSPSPRPALPMTSAATSGSLLQDGVRTKIEQACRLGKKICQFF